MELLTLSREGRTLSAFLLHPALSLLCSQQKQDKPLFSPHTVPYSWSPSNTTFTFPSPNWAGGRRDVQQSQRCTWGCATGQPWPPALLLHAWGHGLCRTVQGQFVAAPRAWSLEWTQ